MPEGRYAGEGSPTSGTLRSLYALDGSPYAMASDGNGNQAASFSVAFHPPADAPSAILHAETGASLQGATAQAFLYSPSAGGLALGAVALDGGNAVEFSISGAQLATYRDASGALNVQFRVYRPGTDAFAWSTDRLVVLTPILSSFVYDNEGTQAAGTLASLTAVDSDPYSLVTQTESATGYQVASFSVGYRVPAGTPSATLRAVTGLPADGATLQFFTYTPAAGGTTLATAAAPNGQGTVDVPITSTQLSTYRDGSGVLNVQFRLYLPGAPGSLTWATDQLVLFAAPNSGPALPTDLTASADANGGIDLAWTDNANNENGFIVERKGGADADFVQVGTAPADAVDYQDTQNLSPSTAYTYRVRATNTNGDSPNGNEASATTNTVNSSGSAIVMTAAATSATKMTVYWSSTTTTPGYNIYRSNAGDSGYVKVNATPVAPVDPGPGLSNSFMFSDDGLATNTKYFYRVVAVDSAGVEGVSSPVSFDIPNVAAVPWDTANSSAILSKVADDGQTLGTWNPDGYTIAIGPNGVEYSSDLHGGAPHTRSAAISYNSGTHVLTTRGGASYPHCAEGEQGSNPQSNIEANFDNAGDTGIFRKVEALPGHQIIDALVYFPTSTYGLNWQSTYSDTADIYVGGASEDKSQNMDIGFQKGSDDTNGLKAGWQIVGFFKKADGSRGFLSDDKEATSGIQGLRFGGVARITAVLPSIGYPTVSAVKITVNAAEYGGAVYGATAETHPSVNVLMYVDNFQGLDYTHFRFKRVNSIAQKAASVENPYLGGGVNKGWIGTGTFVTGAAWGDLNDPDETGIRLDGEPWGVYDTIHAGAFPGRGQAVQWRDGTKYTTEDRINLQLTYH